MSGPSSPPFRKMKRLTVIAKSKDAFEGKPVADVLFSLYKERGLSGATILHGVKGYGARGVSRADVLGLSVNLPVIVETIAEDDMVAEIIPEVKRIVGNEGVVTVEDVSVV